MNNYSGKRLFESWYIPDFEKPLGVGSFGTVFELRSYDTSISPTAVKIISIPKDSSDYMANISKVGATEAEIKAKFEQAKDNLIHEIQMMLKVSGYTNCVGCMAYRVEEHTDCFGWDILIQMEMLETLDSYFRRKGRVSNLDIVRLGIDICNALEVCRANEIVHRDIKPSNIMVKEVGQSVNFKLGDFGVAKVLSSNGTMTMSGTLDYMAPELLVGQGDLRVDIYSLGILLYTLLNANRLPFLPDYPQSIDSKSEERARSKMLKGDPKPEPLYSIGTDLSRIVLKACEHERDKRYDNALEMRTALENLKLEEQMIFTVPATGPYAPSERRMVIRVKGTAESVIYDGKEHVSVGYTSNIGAHNVEVKLAPGVEARAKGTKPGRYMMGLTKESFTVTAEEPNLQIEDIIVEDGYLEIIKRQVKKGWTVLVAVIAASVVLAGIAINKNKAEPPLSEPAQYTPVLTETVPMETEPQPADEIILKIELVPDDTATYSDVTHDTQILERRLKAYGEHVSVDCSSGDGRISATIPLSAIGTKNDLYSVIRATINRPLKMFFACAGYMGYEWDDENSLIDKADIVTLESISAKEAANTYKVPTTYLDFYEHEKTYPADQAFYYMELTEAGAKKFDELKFENDDWPLVLILDVDLEGNSSFIKFDKVYRLEDEGSFVFTSTDFADCVHAEAQAAALKDSALSKSYTFSTSLSKDAHWEERETAHYFGAYQRNFDELSGSLVTLKFDAYDPSEVSEDEFELAVRQMKDRFDIIGLPYAYGPNVIGEKSIVICTDPSKLSEPLLHTMGGGYFDLYINTDNFSDGLPNYLYIEAMDVCKDESSGMYCLEVTVEDPEELKEASSWLFKNRKDRRIFIGNTSKKIAAASVESIIGDGILRFNMLPIAGKVEVDEDYKYIFELVKYENSVGYSPYSISSAVFAESGTGFGISSISDNEHAVAAGIEAAYPGAESWVSLSSGSKTLVIKLHEKLEPGFIGKAFSSVEEIFKEYGLDNMSYFGNVEFDSVRVDIIDTDSGLCRLAFSKFTFGDNLSCEGLCYGDWLDSYYDEFRQTAKSRTFFQIREFGMRKADSTYEE